jgi:hypothetical protein
MPLKSSSRWIVRQDWFGYAGKDWDRLYPVFFNTKFFESWQVAVISIQLNADCCTYFLSTLVGLVFFITAGCGWMLGVPAVDAFTVIKDRGLLAVGSIEFLDTSVVMRFIRRCETVSLRGCL